LIYFISFIPFIAKYLKEAEFLGAKFRFSEEIKETKNIINASGTVKIKTNVDVNLSDIKVKSLASVKKLIDSDPVLALAALRIEIEKSLKNIAKKIDLPYKDRYSINSIIVKFEKKEIFSKKQIIVLRKIIQMCNKAIHGIEVSKDEALEIISLAERFYMNMEGIRDVKS
jgi:hypothetical protein